MLTPRYANTAMLDWKMLVNFYDAGFENAAGGACGVRRCEPRARAPRRDSSCNHPGSGSRRARDEVDHDSRERRRQRQGCEGFHGRDGSEVVVVAELEWFWVLCAYPKGEV